MPRLPHYVPSGRTTILFPIMALVGLALAVALAWPYQRLVTWVPFIYINAVVYLVFAFAVAICAMLASKVGLNRNRVLGAVVGGIIGVSAVGASHYFAYRHAVAEVADTITGAAGELSPELQAEVDEQLGQLTFGVYLEARVATGWSLGRRSGGSGKGDLTGIFVWLIWGIEAIGVIGAAAFVGRMSDPYCERCRTWMKEREVLVRTDLDGPSADALARVASADDLLTPPPYVLDSPSRVRVAYTTHVCPTCDSPGYVTLEKRWDQAMNEDRPHSGPTRYETKTETLLENITLTRAQLARLDALQAAAPAATPG